MLQWGVDIYLCDSVCCIIFPCRMRDVMSFLGAERALRMQRRHSISFARDVVRVEGVFG